MFRMKSTCLAESQVLYFLFLSVLQFQSFSQYRCKTAKKSDEEIEFLRNNPKIWNVHSVLNVLHSLVDKSNINRQLEVYTSGGERHQLALTHRLSSLSNSDLWLTLVFLSQVTLSQWPENTAVTRSIRCWVISVWLVC